MEEISFYYLLLLFLTFGNIFLFLIILREAFKLKFKLITLFFAALIFTAVEETSLTIQLPSFTTISGAIITLFVQLLVYNFIKFFMRR